MLRATLKRTAGGSPARAGRLRWPASNGPDETGKSGPDRQTAATVRDDDLERRRRDLEASLATRRRTGGEGKQGAGAGGAAGYGQALKLSSEFIAGIAVGAGLGWIIDRLAGTSPWGLIVFLLLGFRRRRAERPAFGGHGCRSGHRKSPEKGRQNGRDDEVKSRACGAQLAEGGRVGQRSDPSVPDRRSWIPIEIGGLDFSFTNSSLFMVATVAVAGAFLYLTTSSRGLIPGRLQSISEMSYEFVATMLRDAAGIAGHEVLPVRVLAVHVRAGRQPARHVPLFLHRHQPHHRHLRAGAAGDRHRRRLRLHEARLRLPQAVRAARACRASWCRWSC